MSVKDLSLAELREAAEVGAAIAAASEVGVFEELASGPARADELARRLGLDERASRVVLALLEELGVIRSEHGAYRLTEPARRMLVDREAPEYGAGGLGLWLRNLEAWTQLPAVLRGGGPAPAADVDRETDVENIARYMAGMAAAPRERVLAVVGRCLQLHPDARRVLDLGGGPGHYAREFAARGLEATLFDRPETVAYVREAYGLDGVSGLRVDGGDFLADPIPGGPYDIALLSNVTHLFSPGTNRRLLSLVRDVLAPGGLLAVVDFVRGRSPHAARFAVLMLLRTAEGGTYTESEYRDWLDAAGFRDVQVADLDVDRQVVTAWRAPASNS